MKLIKCSRCGRPYYESEAQCPYCHQDTAHSKGRYVTQSISEPASHQRMQDFFDGKMQQPAAPQPAPAPLMSEMPDPVAPVETVAAPEPEPIAPPEPEVAAEPLYQEAPLSEEVAARAEAIAEVTSQPPLDEEVPLMFTDEDQIETIGVKRRSHVWLWILLILIVLVGAAVAAYFFVPQFKELCDPLIQKLGLF